MNTSKNHLVPNKHLEKNFKHFVHAMEYFYKATSMVLEGETDSLILGGHPHHYVKDFVESISTMPKINIGASTGELEVLENTKEVATSPEWDPDTFDNSIRNWFLSPESAREIRRHIISVEKKPRKSPSIGIINRSEANKRRLVNSEELKSGIKRVFNIEVEETTFDNLSFSEQVYFCDSHDIIISPHGAQICSIPFMPDYGLLVEICHRDYYRPSYFRELALRSGKSYMIICDTHEEELLNKWRYEPESEQFNARCSGRANNVSINMNKLIPAIERFLTTRNINIQDSNYHKVTNSII